MATELKPLTELAEKSDLVVYEGITTSAGDIGGNTVVDSGLSQANNYWNNMVVHIKSGNSNDQVRRISGFVQATGTITVDTAFSTQIAIGTQYDILGQYAGPGGGGDATAANQLLILADTNKIDSATLAVSPTSGSLARFIASGGTALGTQLPASTSLYDVIGYESAVSLANKLTAARAALLDQITALRMAQLDSTAAGKVQIAIATIDLNQGAATYDLLTGTAQNVMVEKLIIRMPDAAAGGALTSISIQTNDSTPQVFISSLLGAVANLTAQAQLASISPVIVAAVKKIQLTITGGATGVAYSCTVTVTHRAVTAGGTLV